MILTYMPKRKRGELPRPGSVSIFKRRAMPYLIQFTVILLLGLLVACAIT